MNIINNSKSIDKFFTKKPSLNSTPLNVYNSQDQVQDQVQDQDQDQDQDQVQDQVQVQDQDQEYMQLNENGLDENGLVDEFKPFANKDHYNFNNKKYFFLNDNLLSQKYGDFMNSTKKYNIQICIFNINNNNTEPFLQYLFLNTKDTIVFPSIEFQCPIQNLGRPDNYEDSQEHIFFTNECSKELLNILPIHDIFNSSVLRQIYKGFIEDGDNLYVLFDSTTIHTQIDSTKYSWAIIDEIVYSQKIINKVFDSKIPELFIKSPFIMYILDETVQRLKQPNLLYLCNKPESVYKNVENIQNIDSIKIIDETIDHELFGSYYICSSMPINGADLTKIKRYAAFTYSPKYILKDISTISQEDKDELIEEFEDSNILSIYFREDGIQLWGIQTSDQITII